MREGGGSEDFTLRPTEINKQGLACGRILRLRVCDFLELPCPSAAHLRAWHVVGLASARRGQCGGRQMKEGARGFFELRKSNLCSTCLRHSRLHPASSILVPASCPEIILDPVPFAGPPPSPCKASESQPTLPAQL